MKKKPVLLPALTIATALLALLSIVVFMLANKENVSRNNQEYLLDNTSQMATLVDDSLLYGLTNIRMLSSLLGSMLPSPTVAVATLQRILDNSVFDFIEFTDKDGKNHNTTGGISEASDRQYYLDAMRGNPGIELIFNSRATHETLLVFYSPVYYHNEFIGSLIGTYKGTKHLEKLLTMDVFGYRAEAYLCNNDGLIIASNQSVDTRQKISINTVLGHRTANTSDNTGLTSSANTALIPLKGNETGACLMRLKNFDWYIVQIFPEQANRMMVTNANRLGIILALFLVTILSVLLFLTYTILNRSRAETQKALVQAEAASKAKTDFLFNMSHDIRTPMNAIMGFLRLLKGQQEVPARRREYISKMEDSSGLLLSMINNVLEMSQLENGTTALDETITSLDQTVDAVLSVVGPTMQEKNITIDIRIDTQHRHIWCDVAKIQEIFLNILNNACTYTPVGGRVSVRVTELPSEKQGSVVFRTEIEDSGIGIAQEFIPHLFDAFSREKNTTHSKTAGTGLGLAIAKRLVELMGGTIAVESERNKGTKFTVVIPHRIPEEKDICGNQEETQAEDFSGKRILLAEDNDFNADIATELLTEVGFMVERAQDGKVCVDMLEQADDGYYDLILMDVQMPNMNGYEATESIRRMSNPSKAGIPIIAMTANTFEEDKNNAHAAGIDAHLAKPVDVRKLIETLKNFSDH